MDRQAAATVVWVSILASIILLAAVGLFAAYKGVPVQESGLREAISGLVALLGVAMAAHIQQNRGGPH